MKDPLTLAQNRIQRLQERWDTFRKETYKTVHDQIGSTLSTVSIKNKLLTDKINDPIVKKQLQENHALIRECLDHVTQLNKELKQRWIPQGPESFLQELTKELETIQQTYGIHVKLEIKDDKQLKLLDFQSINLLQEWIQNYIQSAISRLAQEVTLEATANGQSIQWKFTDTAPISSDSKELSTLKLTLGAKR